MFEGNNKRTQNEFLNNIICINLLYCPATDLSVDYILLAIFCLITGGVVQAQERVHGVQRKGISSLQQSEKRGELPEIRKERGDWSGRSTRMRGRNEASNKGRRRPHCRCQVQNFRMRQRNRFFQSSHSMDQGKKVGRGKQDHEFPNRERTKPSSREDSLQRPSRGRNQSRNKRLQK